MRWLRRRPDRPALPVGRRIYAIGDIHGETQLLLDHLALIRADASQRSPADTTLIFLGDFIDRGAGAAELLFALSAARGPAVVFLKGNHEAALVESYRGNRDAMKFWLKYGGRATLKGLGVEADIDIDDTIDALRSVLDPAIVEWLDQLPMSLTVGDYFFVHAGIRPGIKLDRQASEDLLWIREPFLSSRRNHGKVVVHGHTIEPGVPQLGGNRIGIDTGAHEHGRLTVLGLEGEDQWLL